MVFAPRFRAGLRYVGEADAPFRWRISSSSCPNCAGRYFLSLSPNGFMTRCLRCGANGTNLSLIPVIDQHRRDHPIRRAWEMSTYGATLAFLKGHIETVVTSEFFPDHPPGAVINGVVNQDVQHLTFEDASFDLITSNQVFEHVANDLAGYTECFRVLRAQGALIFSVPLYDMPRTEMIAERVAGEVVFHGEPEYHDSRAGGPKSALTFWHHSVHDICARVARAGFDAHLVEISVAPSQRIPSQVVYAIKPGPGH